jgi:hypothetical protein
MNNHEIEKYSRHHWQILNRKRETGNAYVSMALTS